MFGNDYPTPDGTGIRDYIHVVDLAIGHLRAIEKLAEKPGFKVYNLGTGNGYSVLQIVRAFEAASGRKVPYVIKPRRPGDIAECWADPALAAKEPTHVARLEFPRETSLILRCARKAGILGMARCPVRACSSFCGWSVEAGAHCPRRSVPGVTGGGPATLGQPHWADCSLTCRG